MNDDCVAKSKLTIAVKRFSRYNDQSKVAAKQTNRLRDTETDKHEVENITKGTKRHTYK